MLIVKVNKNFQVTIPAAVRRKLNITEGDFLEAMVTKDGVLYKVKELIDRNISDYWKQKAQEKGEIELSEGGKQKLEKALVEMEQDQTEEFDSVDELIKDLDG